ncbi:MAG: PAS domain S-box protein [Gammaproteobacteria bacterium]|nr:PAS domain S-box protein [Gammaproteobacteria bacterium]
MTASAPPFQARPGALVDRVSLLHRNVLESMTEGVMTVDSDGRIGLFNPAASRLLGLARSECQAKAFAEVFLNSTGLEEFNDAMLAAIYNEAVGSRSTVAIRLEDGTKRSLAVTTSFLTDRRDGESQRIGIVAVFDDITEIETLRRAEQELAESTKRQNTELRDAYREIEETNKALDSALKKVSAVRAVAVVLVVALFVGAAWYVWDTTGTAVWAETAGSSGSATGSEETVVTAVVAARPLKTTLSFFGRLAPRREVRVTSPVAGKVLRVLFEFGARVTAGQPMIELDTSETRRQYRSARAEYLEARERLRALENWESSPEMSRVRRAVARAQMELEAHRNKLAETTLLLAQGIIPASEHEAAQRQHDAQALNYEAALQDLESTLAEADEDSLQITRLQLENAETQMQDLQKTLDSAVIHAPVSGIALRSGEGAEAGQLGTAGQPLAPGRSVSEGEHLVTVGDLKGIAVAGTIDEVDVVKLRPGQPAVITGDAFPGLELAGEIERISSQSRRSLSSRVPSFDVTAAIDELSDTQRQGLRLGMSAAVVVVVRDEPAVLLVPLASVKGARGQYWVQVKHAQTGELTRVPVEVGTTTLREAEIVSGLEAGDEIVVSGG